MPALAARLPEAAAAALRGNPNVAYVEPDGLAYVLTDTIPWGVARIDADLVHATGNLGQGVKVGIIDTGIDFRPPRPGRGRRSHLRGRDHHLGKR